MTAKLARPRIARGRWNALRIALTASAFTAIGVAQDAPPPIDPIGERPDHAGDEVYLNDSFEASDALTRATALVERRRWTDAARLLQEASDRYGDSLIRVAPRYYVGLRRYIADTIAAWPAAGVEAYRSVFERELDHAVSRLAARAGSEETLELFDRFFCTAGAVRLADRIGQQAIESGDLALAQRVYALVLRRHPDAKDHESALRAALVVIDAIADATDGVEDAADRGEEAPPTPRATDPQRAPSSTTLRWMGRDRAVADIVEQIGSEFAPSMRPPGEASWPIFGGNVERNRIVPTNVDELGLLWRYAYPRDRRQPASDGSDRSDDGRQGNRRLSVHAIVDGGIVYAQIQREVVALRRHTGEVVWRFRADESVVDDSNYMEDQPPAWDAVTVDSGRVYLALPGDALPYYSYDSTRTPHELACLNADTGRVVWRTGRRVTEQQFAEIHFDSSPIVRNGHLFIVGRRRRAFGFEDVYLYRYRAADGEFEHRTHVGSASTGSFGSRPAAKSIIAMHGDTVYVCSHLGSIAAVSAHTGAVRWLRVYDRAVTGASRRAAGGAAETRSWHFNALIWSNGRLIARAWDGASVLVLGAEDGDILHEIPASDLEDVTTLLGVRGDVLCGMGSTVACYDLHDAEVLWSESLPEGEIPFGRGVWSGDRLLIPTRDGLSAFAVHDGMRSDAPWVTDARGGNLLATPDTLFVAGAYGLSAYVRKADIWQSLRRRMESAPADPIPALEFAEVALRGGEDDDAIAALREAVARCDAHPTAIEPVATDRLFADVLRFAETLADRTDLNDDETDELLRLAARFASDTARHLDYRLRFAALFERRGRPERSVDLYQQILRDRSLCDVPIAPDSRTAPRGASFAERRIAELVALHGAAVYAVHNEQAEQWLRRALEIEDAAALERVVASFPNSDAAAPALIADGDMRMRSGEPERAARKWTDAYHRYTDRIDRPSIMRRIADAYEAAGQVEYAYRWLTKAAREHPTAMVESDGRSMTLARYRDRLAYIRSRVEPTRAIATLPLDQSYVRTFDQPITLLSPRFADHPLNRWDRCFVLSDEGIRSIDPRDGADRWPRPAEARGKVDLLLSMDAHAVFTDGFHLFALQRTGGAVAWSYGPGAADPGDPGVDWEQADALRLYALQGDRLVSVRESGEMSCIAVNTGALLWTRRHRPIPSERIHLAHDRIVYYAVEDGRTVLCVVDLDTGEWRDAIVTDVDRAVEDIFVTLDEQIIVATSRSIQSVDAQTHAMRWHTASDGHLSRSSLLVELDALYFSQDGRELQKISLDDGRRLWRSDAVEGRGAENLTVEREGNSLIVTSDTSVVAVDPVTGLVLWRGTAAPRARFAARQITGAYVVAVDLPADPPVDLPVGVGDDEGEGDATVYCYDHRNASGLIPRDGAPTLRPLDAVHTVLAADGALLFQSQRALQALTHRGP